MADIDPAFVEQILNVSKRQWKSNIHHNRQTDDFVRRLEVAKSGTACHPETLNCRLAQLKLVSSDRTPLRGWGWSIYVSTCIHSTVFQIILILKR